ncbi:MAG TPA: pilus assembly protein PilM [Polyangiaceae bacterium]|nr:pilus assembly protein PilM [Polyangiaceae bacterium]
MARLVGIDVRATHVRVALLQTQYRGVKLVGYRQAPLNSPQELEETLRLVGLPLVQQGEHIASCVSGDQLFIRDIELPPAASKQLADVVPFEIEAQVPLDFDELCYDYRLLGAKAGREGMRVLSVATRISLVRQQIDLVQRALGVEPERVGAGPLPLANLAQMVPELRGPGLVAVLDVGLGSSDLLVLSDGMPVFARTLSVGAEAGGQAMVAALRQSQAAWLQRGSEPFLRLFLAGAGPTIDGAAPVLSEALGLAVTPLPALAFEGVPPEALTGFEKALGLALSLTGQARDLNLRRGPLAYQHSYAFLKTKAPIVSALVAIILVSFIFSVWAKGKSLDAENESLRQTLASLSQQTLGERVESVEELTEILDRAGSSQEKDPQPELDAFDIMVEVSKSIPDDIIHDIDEFDVQNDKVKLLGIVSVTDEAERIAGKLGEHRCFKEVKISKITQVVNSNRQKYTLTFDVNCSADKKAAAKAPPRGARQP